MIWKPIPCVDGAMANDLGQIQWPECEAMMPNGVVRKYTPKPIFGTKTKASKTALHCYMGVLYRGKNYKIHRLVCEAFHGAPPFPRAVVIHINENGTDNRPENLRWGTQKENLNMPKFLEYCRGRTGEKSPTTIHRRKMS